MPLIRGIGRANDSRFPVGRRMDDAPASVHASRALVPVTLVATNGHLQDGSGRPATAFVAHLAATRQRAPQTRAGRRSDPAEAVAAYATMLSPRAKTGRVFRRSV